MTTAVNEQIEKRRIELGLSMENAADSIDLNLDSYYDIELHDDEVYSIPIIFVKKLFKILMFDFLELFEIPCAFCMRNEPYLDEYGLLRNELVQKRRISKKISKEEISDRLGFYEIAITNMEDDKDILEEWSIELITDLSRELEIPLQVLLGVKCSKCGR